jgi:hypothetical protein
MTLGTTLAETLATLAAWRRELVTTLMIMIQTVWRGSTYVQSY